MRLAAADLILPVPNCEDCAQVPLQSRLWAALIFTVALVAWLVMLWAMFGDVL